MFNRKLCVPRKSVSTILHMAYDSKLSVKYKFAKTLDRLNNFHWRQKDRDVKRYVDGCIICQQYRDRNQKKLTHPVPLEIPERRWISLETDLVVHFPKSKDRFDAITTWVHRLK